MPHSVRSTSTKPSWSYQSTSVHTWARISRSDDEHAEHDERGHERSAAARTRRARRGAAGLREGHGVAVLVVGNR